MHFVREVYQSAADIEVPPIDPKVVPEEWNISRAQLDEPPPGHLMFLRDRSDQRDRLWTHAVIILPGKRCIHCSRYFGGKVIESDIDDLLTAKYDFVEGALV